jgi:serine/threonine protein kinase
VHRRPDRHGPAPNGRGADGEKRRHAIVRVCRCRPGILGSRRSEEPYSVEDEDLLATVGHAVALITPRESADGFEECPACGCCYVPGTALCADDGTGLVRQALPHVLEGRYSLMRRIGRGGMGTVYAADDSALDRRVAVKVLAEDLRDPAAADRFRVEAQNAAALAHPNVVTVYDIGVSKSGRAFFVMELLDGIPLSEELKRAGPFDPERSLRLLKGICAAVRTAHARRIVHRDLKPQNIVLCGSEAGESPKVLDFGLAKALEITRGHTPTRQGMVLGTLRYMSPEQLRGEEASVDDDLWALALIALEMLAGSDATERTSGVAPRLEHLPLTQSLRQAFAKALAPDPLDRPASVDELLESVERALSELGQAT